jgi:SNF2 family DNA or RNA helicase
VQRQRLWALVKRALSERVRNECGQSEVSVRQLVTQHLVPGTWDRLFEHQRCGVAFVLRMSGRAYLADDMGVGKTAQVRRICVLAHTT